MKKLLISAALLAAIVAPASAQQNQPAQQNQSAGSSYFIVQDTQTKKCIVQNSQPTTGSSMQVIGSGADRSYATHDEAQKALDNKSGAASSCLQ